jgi:signal transduction histidine kinase
VPTTRRLPHDLLLAVPPVGIAALGLVESFATDLGSDMHGPAAVNAAFTLACAVPLLWRHAHPRAVLVAVALVAMTWANSLYLHEHQAPIEPFLALLVALFATAQRVPTADARPVVGVLLLAFAAGDVAALALGRDPGDVLPAYVFFAGTWVVGRALRNRQSEARTHSVRAALAEAERDRRVADERARIARELHDVIAHSISAMVVHAAAERRALGDERPQTADTLALIERSGREALSELRHLLGVLRKRDAEDLLAPQPGLAGLDGLLESVRAAGLEVDVAVEGRPRALAPGVDLSAYRIIQEALTNVRKHAGSDAGARVLVRYGARDVLLEVADDGRGSATDLTDAGGHGLIGMRERVSLFNGTLEAGPLDGGGFRVRATLPAEAP